MIGGTDVLIPAIGDETSLEACSRIIRRYWPDCRFEDAETSEKFKSPNEIPFGKVRDLLVYRNAESEQAWDADDANSSQNSMLYFISRPSEMTVTLDDPNTEEMRSIVDTIRRRLLADFYLTYSTPARAA